MWEDLLLEEHVMGEEKFNEKGAGFSTITIKKNNENINTKNLKLTEIITHMRGSKNTLA